VRFKEISHEDNNFLLGKFSLEEVKGVVWNVKVANAPTRMD